MVQRPQALLHTGFPLWNRETNVSDFYSDHIEACFPANGGDVGEYLEEIDQLLSSTKHHEGPLQSGNVEIASKLVDLTGDFTVSLKKMSPKGDAERRYLDLIGHFNRLLNMISRSVLLRAEGREKEAVEILKGVVAFLKNTEELTHRYLDTWLILRSMHFRSL